MVISSLVHVVPFFIQAKIFNNYSHLQTIVTISVGSRGVVQFGSTQKVSTMDISNNLTLGLAGDKFCYINDLICEAFVLTT